MSRTVPEWVNDPDPCPVDDCDGHYWHDVAGTTAQPVKVVNSTCGHDPRQCTECRTRHARDALARYAYTVAGLPGGPGRTSEVYLCPDCNTRENYREWVPDHAAVEYKRGERP